MPRVLRVVVELHWGYSVKHPLYSASQPSLRFPPPTSLLGALAYPLHLQEAKPETLIVEGSLYSSTVELLDLVPWVCYRISNLDPRSLVETRDIGKVLIAPYVRGENVYPGSPNIWAVQVHGKVYAPTLTLDIVYVVANSNVDTAKLVRAAWGIARLGVKEAIASTVNVELLDATLANREVVETRYGFPQTLAKPLEGGYVASRLPLPHRDWYRLAEVRDPTTYMDDYILPVDQVKARLSERGAALKVEKQELGYVIVPKEVVSP